MTKWLTRYWKVSILLAQSIYIDDIVIYGKNETYYMFLEMLDMVLDRMANFNVRLNPSKFFFAMTSMQLL